MNALAQSKNSAPESTAQERAAIRAARQGAHGAEAAAVALKSLLDKIASLQ